MVGDRPGRGRDGVIGHGQASKGNTADGAMYDSNRDGEFMLQACHEAMLAVD